MDKQKSVSRPKKVQTKKTDKKSKKTGTKSKKGFLGFVKEVFQMNGGGDGHCPEGMIENLETGQLEKFDMNGGGLGRPYRRGQNFRSVLERVKENNNNNNVRLPPRKRNTLKNEVIKTLIENDYERGRIKTVWNNTGNKMVLRHYYGHKPSQKRFEVILKNGKITNVIEQNNGEIALPSRTTRKNNNNNTPKRNFIITNTENQRRERSKGNLSGISLPPRMKKNNN